jgi:hypothetical protein
MKKAHLTVLGVIDIKCFDRRSSRAGEGTISVFFCSYQFASCVCFKVLQFVVTSVLFLIQKFVSASCLSMLYSM